MTKKLEPMLTPAQIARKTDANPEGMNIIPFSYRKVLELIKTGEIRVINMRGEHNPQYYTFESSALEDLDAMIKKRSINK